MKYTIGVYVWKPDVFTFRFKGSSKHHQIPTEFCQYRKATAGALDAWLESEYDASSVSIRDNWEEITFRDPDKHLMFVLKYG